MPPEPHDDSPTSAADTAHEELIPAEQDSPNSDATSDREPIREEVAVESEHEVRVRRTPRYGRFMILGGAIFGVASFIVTYSLPQGAGYDRNTVFGFVLLGAVAVGVALGALAAIIAAAATRHTERTVVADRIDVRQAEATADSPELPDLGELPAEADGPRATPALRPSATPTTSGPDGPARSPRA